jgi:hypothetical protein
VSFFHLQEKWAVVAAPKNPEVLSRLAFLPNFAQWSFAISAPFLSISLVVHSVPPTSTAMPCSLAVMTFAVPQATNETSTSDAIKTFMN